MKLRYRTIFISDAHLGSRGCQARDLVRFLRCVSCERLYLVGDIIDLWRLKSRSYWPVEHNDVIQCLLRFVREGARVVLIPGNHDEAAREYVGVDVGGVQIMHHDVHETADGRKLFVTHGDQYDLVVRHSRLLSLIGSAAYEWLIAVNRWYNITRQWRGKPYWSLSRYLKLKVKSACTYVSRYEDALATEARRRRLDGVVCGHIHKAEAAMVGARDGGEAIEYYNCGDWVESCTAVVEHADGRMEVIEALSAIADLVRAQRAEPAHTEAVQEVPVTV